MTNNCIKNPIEISAALHVWRTSNAITQQMIEYNTGVDQSQISRIFSGKFLRVTPSVLKICKYAKINLIKEGDVDPKTNSRIMDALEKTWDGTDRHAKLIAKVILALANHN